MFRRFVLLYQDASFHLGVFFETPCIRFRKALDCRWALVLPRLFSSTLLINFSNVSFSFTATKFSASFLMIRFCNTHLTRIQHGITIGHPGCSIGCPNNIYDIRDDFNKHSSSSCVQLNV
uniref:Uncharacterized protein n=1 Tax=Cacopsylla melanoneura TaxID=428564 RepID=A0A8D8RTU3_9HEMI